MQHVLVGQGAQVADHLPAVGDYHRQIRRHPPRIMTARRDRRPANANDNVLVKPVRSADSRNSAVPACDTTPVPLTETTGNGGQTL